MRNIAVLIKNNLRILLVKKPLYSILMVLLPLIISLVMVKFMSIGNKPFVMAVVDNDQSYTSSKIIESFNNDKIFNVVNVNYEDDLEGKFASKDINVAVVIDENFEKNILKGSKDGITIKGLESDSLYIIIKERIENNTNNLINLAKINDYNFDKYKESVINKEDYIIKVTNENLKGENIDYSTAQGIIGYMVMFALYRAMSGTALINEDKEQNVYTRVLASSIKTWQYYVANIISVTILLIFLFGLSVLGIKFIVDVNLGISTLNLFIILSIVAVVSVSIGTFCNTVTEDRDLSSILSNILTISFLFLGGCFIPIDYLPDIINKISYFTPIRWVMESISNIQNGANISVILMNIGILILFIILFFITAIYSINRRDKTDYVN